MTTDTLERQNERETALRRWQVEGQRKRIHDLKAWLAAHRKDEHSIRVGWLIASISIEYLADCGELGMAPELPKDDGPPPETETT